MSSFAWLDFSESDRQKALDVIDLFRDKGTVDELGIGTIRDSIADLLFPGTSTIMTRARYYLFIPWIYLRHEKNKTTSSEIAQASRKDEIALIEALRKTGESLGVIGIDAGPLLKRLPSTIYWQSLGVLGIRRYNGSIDSYQRSLDSFKKKGDVLRGEDGHVIAGGNLRRWDSLPAAPEGFLRESSLQLTREDANYLRERIMLAAPRSLFAFLADHPLDDSTPHFPWNHLRAAEFPEQNRRELVHARNFSEMMHGSALLYNLMLAEKKPEDSDRISRYQARLREWAEQVSERHSELSRWPLKDFWKIVRNDGANVPRSTEAFATNWIEMAISKGADALEDSKHARNLITVREKKMKGVLARLTNARALDLWGGASSSEQLTYRWNRPVKAILADIREPLDK